MPHGRLWESLMRYMPAALALSLLVAVTGSVGSARVGQTIDPRARALIDGGRSLLARGDVDAATDSFESALAVDPGNPETYLPLGDPARSAGPQGMALHYYRRARDGDPKNLATHSG